MSKFRKWVYDHAIVSLGLIIWCVAIVSWVVVRSFSDNPPDIPTGTVAALGTILGLPAIVIGLWKWRSDKPDE